MRQRLYLCAGLIVCGALGLTLTLNGVFGQPPASPPKTLPPDLVPPAPVGPKSKGVVPASGVVAPPSPVAVPASPSRKAAPIDRFRNYEQLPELTREIVFATQRGMEWLSRDGIHQPNGRFIPGLNPALGKATDDDSFVRQAIAALALARSARLTGDEKHAVRAGQTVLSLLAETPKDAANPGMRKPTQPNAVCNRVGAASLLAMAIYELPDAAAELRQCGEELCQFLRGNQKADGSIQVVEPGDESAAEMNQAYAGAALAAIAMSNRATPTAWKQEVLARALPYYRQQFKANPQVVAAPWLMVAFAEMHLQSKQSASSDFVFEMADWCAKLQYESPDRQRAAWRGGFATVVAGKIVQAAPTADTAYIAIGLADVCRMIRNMEKPDTQRYDRYRMVLTRALQFVATLQYGEENTVHFASHFRPALVGGFHGSLSDGNIRVDQSAAAVCALTQYLIAGVDR